METWSELKSRGYEEKISGRTGEGFSFSRVLSEEAKLNRLFVHHDVLPPGRRIAGFHAHSDVEEVFVVLRGTVVTTTGTESGCVEVVLGPGEWRLFPAEEFHTLENRGTENAEILVVANRSEVDRVRYLEKGRST